MQLDGCEIAQKMFFIEKQLSIKKPYIILPDEVHKNSPHVQLFVKLSYKGQNYQAFTML